VIIMWHWWYRCRINYPMRRRSF